MEDLPFPYAKNQSELMENIRNFDRNSYQAAWEKFKEEMGLHETGHAGADIAYVVSEFLKGNKEPLAKIENDDA